MFALNQAETCLAALEGDVGPRGRRRRAPAHRVRAHQPRVPAADRGARQAAEGDGTGAARVLGGLRRDPRPVLPERVARRTGWGRRCEQAAGRAHVDVPVRQRRAGVVQRGAHDAALAARADGAGDAARRAAAHRLARVPRLLGHGGHRVRGAHAARVDGHHGRAPGRGGRARAAAVARGLGHAARRRAARPAGGVPHRHADDRAARRRGRAGPPGRGRPRAGRRRARGGRAPCATRWSTSPASRRVHTPASEAWTARAGVCQDIAHLVTGALRSIGIPARYVSGYLHPDSDGGAGQHRAGRLARVGRVVGGRVVRLRRDQPRDRGRPPRRARARAVVRRRAAAARASTRAPGRRTPRCRCGSRARPERSRGQAAAERVARAPRRRP